MLSRMARIAIIGGGSIGEALLSGMLRAGRQVKDLVVAEKFPDRAKYLSETYSVLVTTVADAARHLDVTAGPGTNAYGCGPRRYSMDGISPTSIACAWSSRAHSEGMS